MQVAWKYVCIHNCIHFPKISIKLKIFKGHGKPLKYCQFHHSPDFSTDSLVIEMTLELRSYYNIFIQCPIWISGLIFPQAKLSLHHCKMHDWWVSSLLYRSYIMFGQSSAKSNMPFVRPSPLPPWARDHCRWAKTSIVVWGKSPCTLP